MKKKMMDEYTSVYNAVMKVMNAFSLSLSLSLAGFVNIATMNKTYNESQSLPRSYRSSTHRDSFLDYYMGC